MTNSLQSVRGFLSGGIALAFFCGAGIGRADTKWVAYKDLGPFVVSLARDQQQNLWIGTEDQGVYRLNPVANELEQFVSPETFLRQKGKAGLAPGLGDDNGYALACDKLGRVWVGHLNHGVSVFNGKDWKTYDVTNGPLGERIFKIVVCPTDGDVWMATSAGLARYSEVVGRVTPRGESVLPNNPAASGDAAYSPNGIWRYYTRAEGLPSDQINALAFDAKGNLVVGTQCDGIAIASAANDYKTWAVVGRVTARGEGDTLPLTPRGSGLPTNLINEVLVTREGTIYAATTTGLAWSFDSGKTWSYLRGHDYADKVRGLWGGAPKGWKEADKEVMDSLLPEDYITCLAEDENGNLLLGFRQQGYAIVQPPRNLVVGRVTDAANPVAPTVPPRNYVNKPKDKSVVGGEKANLSLPTILSHWSKSEGMPDEYVKAILPSEDGNHAVGFYGGGVIQFAAIKKENSPSSNLRSAPSSFSLFPVPAQPPTLAELQEQLQKINAHLNTPASAVYLGEDWNTQGDWVGRYGRQENVLCAMMACFSHSLYWLQHLYNIEPRLGPHSLDGKDTLRGWIHWEQTDNPRSLYNPIIGYRRQAEWDDHGETYPPTFEGPDVWISVEIPQGIYRVSLYFFNKDGHEGGNRFRDYTVEIKPYFEGIESAQASPAIARGRVKDFWGGVYKQFSVSGPQKYWIKIAKNGSLNTICSAVLIDRMTGPELPFDDVAMPWLGGLDYSRPKFDKHDFPSKDWAPSLQKADELWSALDASYQNPNWQRPCRIFAYRAALSASAPKELLNNWRWTIPLWMENDRPEFKHEMMEAWKAQLKITPNLRSGGK